MSRVDQVGELEEYLGTSIEDIQATNHYTTIQIVVSINQRDIEDGDLKVSYQPLYYYTDSCINQPK